VGEEVLDSPIRHRVPASFASANVVVPLLGFPQAGVAVM